MSDYRNNFVFIKVRNTICNIIDFFYPPFKKLMPLHTFRYLFNGGSTFVLDIILYYISFNFILAKQDVSLLGITISSHIFALIISFCIVTPYNFGLSKFIVFQSSNLKGRIQLFRYFVIVGVNLTLNYVLIKLFVEICHIFPTVSKIITAVLIAIFSYLVNQRFTFGISNNKKKARIGA